MSGYSVHFHEADLRQIRARGMTLEKVRADLQLFKRGFPFVQLQRPCTIGDGITVLQPAELDDAEASYMQAVRAGRVTKFVPASGAASRMFHLLQSCADRFKPLTAQALAEHAENGDPDAQMFLHFVSHIQRFAFYDELRSVMAREGRPIEKVLARGEYQDIVTYLLSPRGLNYADLPKGLIKFHHYGEHVRTPIEEHLVEAAAYTQDQEHVARVHFTVSPDYVKAMHDHIEQVQHRYEQAGTRFVVTFSVQKPSTDTIAVDHHNEPFRDGNGQLVFRPSGHGALLENLNDLQGDIVFIKNIDNVVPDRLKPETYRYKRILGGYLIQLQTALFSYLDRLSRKDISQSLLDEAFAFARQKLFIMLPPGLEHAARDEKVAFLVRKLNRPLRVCGVVKNTGEPGGGPFWVEHADRTVSLQIVESAQVNMQDADQRRCWESATHFNPVDLVCGVRDFLGKPFDLPRFVDLETGFIVHKSKDSRELRSLELPGLWNGAMADWNTVFIEVPVITFNPVKTVFDLLRAEHRTSS
jgi:hypothetical protein